MKQKHKVIFDTDPGVDDTTALVFALNDPQFDIKLISIAKGNISLDNATRNMCHLLDIFEKDIPVVKGYEERYGTNTEDAVFLHGEQGMGSYLPPKTTKHKPIKKDCADAMYEVLKQYPNEITVIILGPHTNFAHLLKKHPDSKNLIKQVIMMGGAPNGIKYNPQHNSFNIRTDAPAFQCTIDSGLPILMCPSTIGRDRSYFTEKQVEEIKNTNQIGKFLWLTFGTYWEPNYPDKRIATNDVCAIYYLTHPMLYKTKKAFIEVDTENTVGKTTATYNRKGNFKVVLNINRKGFQKLLFSKLKKMNKIQISDKTFLKNLSGNE